MRMPAALGVFGERRWDLLWRVRVRKIFFVMAVGQQLSYIFIYL